MGCFDDNEGGCMRRMRLGETGRSLGPREGAAIVVWGRNNIIWREILWMWRKVGGGEGGKEWWSTETLTRKWAGDKRYSIIEAKRGGAVLVVEIRRGDWQLGV